MGVQSADQIEAERQAGRKRAERILDRDPPEGEIRIAISQSYDAEQSDQVHGPDYWMHLRHRLQDALEPDVHDAP